MMDRLDTYFIAYNQIDEQTEYTTFEINPKALINYRRIDLVVKYYYIRAKETGENIEFAQELYKKHIEAFTDGTFQEHGSKEKTSLTKYIEVFDQMIDSFREEGFDAERSVIPIGRNNEILDGSHRTACALYFNSKVKVRKYPSLSADYGFDFFRRRLLDEVYLDFIAKEYVELKSEVATLLVWPRAGTYQNINQVNRELEKREIDVVYKKKLKLDEQVLRQLIYSVYREEHWVGLNPERCKAIDYKTDQCHHPEGFLVIYLLEGISNNQLVEIKEKLREDFQVAKSSVHTADTHQESVDIVNFLFDKNYEEILAQNYYDRKKKGYTLKRSLYRKARYYYRRMINQIKRIIGKPV